MACHDSGALLCLVLMLQGHWPSGPSPCAAPGRPRPGRAGVARPGRLLVCGPSTWVSAAGRKAGVYFGPWPAPLGAQASLLLEWGRFWQNNGSRRSGPCSCAGPGVAGPRAGQRHSGRGGCEGCSSLSPFLWAGRAGCRRGPRPFLKSADRPSSPPEPTQPPSGPENEKVKAFPH